MTKRQYLEKIIEYIAFISKEKERKEINFKQQELNKYIIELSKKELSESDYQNLQRKLEKIYDGHFRHFYSEILITLLKINFSEDCENSFEQLAENMRNFYEYIENEYILKYSFDKEFLKKIRKLNDHITMDLARINYYTQQQKNYEEKHTVLLTDVKNISKKINEEEKRVNILKNKTEEATKYFRNTSKELYNTRKESQNIKKDLLSIMGLFLAIFTLFQFNISQLKDLLEYDPFKRVIYTLVINSLFLLGVFFIFTIIDFLIYRTAKMIRIFLDKNMKLTKYFWSFFSIYTLFLIISLTFLSKDSARRELFEIKSDLEKIEENYIDYKENLHLIKENELKIKELTLQIENLKIENSKFKKNKNIEKRKK